MYPEMTDLLVPVQNGDFRVEYFEVGSNDLYAKLHGIFPGRYVRLMHGDHLMMSNTMMEKRTNAAFCNDAHGDILIGGLGLGLIVAAIQDNQDVHSITVLEKHQEVIDMIAPQIKFNDKVKIIRADVFDWKPEKGIRYDCIYMDIWSCINSDIYRKEMVPLKRKWAHYLKDRWESPYRFNRCWAEYQAKNDLKLF